MKFVWKENLIQNKTKMGLAMKLRGEEDSWLREAFAWEEIAW